MIFRSSDLPGAPTRRALLVSLASGLVVAAKGQAPAIVTSKNRVETPGCMLASEQTEGPYYIDQSLVRRDITESRPGVPLRLEIVVLDGRRCTPVSNAAVSIWHCDASGVYSGFTAQKPDGPPRFRPGMRPPGGPPPHHGPSDNTRFFRGVQLTDDSGQAQFVTIYPGWYMGRATHIHLKVMTAGSVKQAQYAGGHVCHTGQLFFPEDMSDAIGRVRPYSAHQVERTLQQDDDVFTTQHGNDFVVALTRVNPHNLAEGLATRVVMGVDPDAEPDPVGSGGPPPRPS